MRLVIVLLVLSCVACGSIDKTAYNASDYFGQGLDDPATKKKLDDLASGVAASAAAGALSPATRKQIDAILFDMETALVATGVSVREELLSGLDVEIRRLVRAAIDEALSSATSKEMTLVIDDLREQLLGAPLRSDLDDALADISPKLIALAKEASANATLGASGVVSEEVSSLSQELQKWKWIAITLCVGVIILIFLHAHAVHAMTKRNDE